MIFEMIDGKTFCGELAFMRDDIRPAKITTKSRFENANLKFHHVLISKAEKMKRMAT